MEKATAVPDPCTQNMLMENLHRRHPNYTTAWDESNLCDYQLDEGCRNHDSLLMFDVVWIKCRAYCIMITQHSSGYIY